MHPDSNPRPLAEGFLCYEQANAVGDEVVGGTVATPDQGAKHSAVNPSIQSTNYCPHATPLAIAHKTQNLSESVFLM
jgi:hypothetical protein